MGKQFIQTVGWLIRNMFVTAYLPNVYNDNISSNKEGSSVISTDIDRLVTPELYTDNSGMPK